MYAKDGGMGFSGCIPIWRKHYGIYLLGAVVDVVEKGGYLIAGVAWGLPL